jgi:hypothetical protein
LVPYCVALWSMQVGPDRQVVPVNLSTS